MTVKRINGIGNCIRNAFIKNDERLARQNNKAFKKFVKLDFDDFPKGSPEEKLYEARTMLGKIAKDNNIHITLKKSEENPDIINLDIYKRRFDRWSAEFVSDHFCCDLAKNEPKNSEKIIGNLLYADKDGLDYLVPRIMKSEDTFLRSVYRKLDEGIKSIQQNIDEVNPYKGYIKEGIKNFFKKSGI